MNDIESISSPRKQIHVVGGGTIEPIHSHLALNAPAYGTTARNVAKLCEEYMPEMDTNLHLTRMADPSDPRSRELQTSEDLRTLARGLVADYATKVIFWSPMVCDFTGQVPELNAEGKIASDSEYSLPLKPVEKIVPLLRREGIDGNAPRKDILAVGFKTTVNAPKDIQYAAGLRLLKQNSLNLVLANDTGTRNNMIIAPEETIYGETTDRTKVLRDLVEMVMYRSQMSFTRSTVVEGSPEPWNSERVPQNLRTVVDHLIARGAYKPFRGVTAGHFAAKLGDREFLTSRRKTNFNELDKVGLVRIETDGDDNVIAYGSKPSVGGQSQRIIFEQHPGMDCIAHAHIPLRAGSKVPVVSQREYECGSHQCGQNTSNGLGIFNEGRIEAVYLDGHGPNIVFNHDTDPQEIISFIEENFDPTAKTGGYAPID